MVIAAGCFFAWTHARMTPENLCSAEITNTADDAAIIYALNPSAANDLLAALNGTPVSSIPDRSRCVYQLLLRHKLLYSKKYTLYFFDDGGVFMEDSITKQISRLENSNLLHSLELFDSQYPFRDPPAVKWFSGSETASKEEFLPQEEITRWHYKKHDGQWYPSAFKPREIIRANAASASGNYISFVAGIQPDVIHVSAQDDATGEMVLDRTLKNTEIPLPQDDGTYRFRIDMEWNDGAKPYRGTYSCEFVRIIDLPPALEFSAKTVTQGDVITVRMHNVNENETPVLEQLLFKPFILYKGDSGYTGYLPTNYATSPGEYKIRYGVEGGRLAEDYITIRARDFRIQRLTIDPAVESSTRNDAAYAQYNKYFNPVRQTSEDTLYYSEPFVIPAAGRLTTEFGETRYVNGAPTSYRHSGLDIAASQGTPVYAANRGKVVLSMFLTLTGNTVVIDHGQGLFSVYFHMHALRTESGSIVERGQQIGTVGTTGFSTGSHLHFTMSILERNIEPGYFLAGEPITYGNYKDYLK